MAKVQVTRAIWNPSHPTLPSPLPGFDYLNIWQPGARCAPLRALFRRASGTRGINPTSVRRLTVWKDARWAPQEWRVRQRRRISRDPRAGARRCVIAPSTSSLAAALPAMPEPCEGWWAAWVSAAHTATPLSRFAEDRCALQHASYFCSRGPVGRVGFRGACSNGALTLRTAKRLQKSRASNTTGYFSGFSQSLERRDVGTAGIARPAAE